MNQTTSCNQECYNNQKKNYWQLKGWVWLYLRNIRKLAVLLIRESVSNNNIDTKEMPVNNQVISYLQFLQLLAGRSVL